jgi:hypothetical protein
VDSTGVVFKIFKLTLKTPSVKFVLVHLTMKLYAPTSALSVHDSLPSETVNHSGIAVVPGVNVQSPELVMSLPVLVMAEYSVDPAVPTTPSGDPAP